MHAPQILEMVSGLVLAGLGVLLARFLYLAYRRVTVPAYLKNGVAGDFLSVFDLSLLVIGGILVVHGFLPLITG